MLHKASLPPFEVELRVVRLRYLPRLFGPRAPGLLRALVLEAVRLRLDWFVQLERDLDWLLSFSETERLPRPPRKSATISLLTAHRTPPYP